MDVSSLMLKIHVALLNGNPELLTLLPSSTVQDVRIKAQRAFGKKHLRLITAKNRVLMNFEQTLEEAEIEDGECLTALVLQPQLAATAYAFALWCQGDSAIVTWGSAKYGGDSSAVQDQLKGVMQIQASEQAFAAILEDGTVVTWGRADVGGDSSAVQDQLRGVMQIQASEQAFAAILEDGTVVTWGEAVCGGDSSAVQDQLKSVRQIQAQVGPLLRFWKMDPSSAGVMQTMVVTVRQFEISSGVWSRFRPHIWPLLRFWKMDLSLPGVMHALAVTVRQFKISSGVSCRFKPQNRPLLRCWQMDPSSPGVLQTVVVTVRQFEISSGVSCRFKPQNRPLLRFWKTEPS